MNSTRRTRSCHRCHVSISANASAPIRKLSGPGLPPASSPPSGSSSCARNPLRCARLRNAVRPRRPVPPCARGLRTTPACPRPYAADARRGQKDTRHVEPPQHLARHFDVGVVNGIESAPEEHRPRRYRSRAQLRSIFTELILTSLFGRSWNCAASSKSSPPRRSLPPLRRRWRACYPATASPPR